VVRGFSLLATSLDKLTMATPFLVTALVTALGTLLNDRLQSRADSAREHLYNDITNAGGRIRGLPSAGPKSFSSIAAWMGDAAAAFTGITGLLISGVLLLIEAGATAALPYIALLTFIVMLVFFARLLLADPSKHRYDWPTKLTPLQIALVGCNVALAVAVLLLA
jgi:hypothetical protein